ncbi:response regulator [Salinimicrobium oceani]|uniref:Response regulator n=1 Tax=Salinimicrobium oceani TaxID=2722702 RepID=A0ABX1CUY1_9FLAO|nr:response regulator [Salinimicrobium oceani]NJW51562.1 response regulator [Salinimicrobium oceani]
MAKTALIIQQDLILLKVLERMILSHQYQCKAIRALDELNIEDQSENFDIIISDILFDGIAPLDYVFQIKEIIKHQTLLIITSMGQKKVRQEILNMGHVAGFFAVPFNFDKVETYLH